MLLLQNRFDITSDAADRCLQFMRDIIRHFSFEQAVFLFGRDVVQGDFKTIVVEDQ